MDRASVEKQNSIFRNFSRMDYDNRSQLFSHEGQLSNVLLRFEYNVVEGMAHIPRNESSHVSQYLLGLRDLYGRTVSPMVSV